MTMSVLYDGLIYALRSVTGWPQRLRSDERRWGSGQIDCYRFLLESQRWSSDQLLAYQWQQLAHLLDHAYHNTEFYRRRFDDLGAKPGDIRNFDDFRRLPVLTKDEVRAFTEELKSRQFEQLSPVESRTGGSTGAPLFLYKSSRAEHMRVAVSWRSREWAGVDYRARKVLIEIHHAAMKQQPGWYLDSRSNSLLLWAGRLDEDRLERYLRLCRWFKPQMLIGSIGFMRVFGRFLESKSEKAIRPGAIFVVGETVAPSDRENIKRQFGCELFDAYGMRENAVSASECAQHRLHINSEFTYVEFEDLERDAGGERCAIIGTNLHNLAFPLIRYRTEDVGHAQGTACACGKAHPVMSIEGGRTRDFLRTREGHVFVSWHLAQFIDKRMGVRKMQLHQHDFDHVTVRIVRGPEFTPNDEAQLLASLNQLAGDLLRFRVEYVDEIPRTPLGKHLFVKSDLVDGMDELRA